MVLVSCILSDYAIYLYQVLRKFPERFKADMKFTRGRNSVKTVGGLTVLIFCNRLVELYICTKFRENISEGLRVTE